MTSTAELREELRELLDEAIPDGGTESNTRFKDTQIDKLLTAARNIEDAAYRGWLRKASMYQREIGQVQSYNAGQERYDMVKLKDAQEYAFRMAEQFKNNAGMGSMVLGVTPPNVL